jgi:two-component system cell cycle response regulator
MIMVGNQTIKILVVDDAMVMRRAIEKMLQADYEILLANDGEAGWEILARDDKIQMLITDIQMPILDGYGLICRVRADGNARIRDLPIITVTGAEDDETRIRAYACGSTDFITKPFDKKLLQSRVHAYMRLKGPTLLQAGVVENDINARDPLTNLKGLGAFVMAGKDCFQQTVQSGEDLSVAVLDIDDFSGMRRQHGEAFANGVLKRVAGLLNNSASSEDVVAHVGDAEFAVLMPKADRAQAMARCERLRESVAAEVFATASGPAPITASFGLVTLSADATETFEKLLVLVEQRLSQARSDGGNRVGVTLLSDVMPEPEEVVLTGVSDEDASDEGSGDAIDLSADLGDLSVDELEALVRAEKSHQKVG